MNTPEERLRKVMEDLGVSRKEMSETLGISVASISMYFKKKSKIRKIIALATQGRYGVNAEWILYNKSPKFIGVIAQTMDVEAREVGIEFSLLPKPYKKVLRFVLKAFTRSGKS